MNDMSRTSTDLAVWVIDQLVELGVEHVVLAPGSRSAPLAFELAERAERGQLVLHTRIDERTAAFLALGIAKGSRRPAVVVTTSGTAVANLHPAMLEASHVGVPLIALTADRPAVLRGTGANQTTDQVGIFGEAAVFLDLSVDSVDDQEAVVWDQASPLHVNVQFGEPLVPARELAPFDADLALVALEPSVISREPSLVALEPSVRTVVVAGDDSGRAGRQIAEAGGWPLLAEPTSGSRTGTHALRTYRLLLQSGLAEEIERVVVTGHPTLSRPVARLLARPDVEVISVRSTGRWPRRPFAVVAEVDEVEVRGQDTTDWLGRWREADCSLAGRIDGYVRELPGLTPYEVAAEVAAALPAGGLLWVGASNPIRDLDLMAPPTPVGERRMVMANRGLAGIDGTLSSALGATIARRPTRAIAYVGDVTFLHDITALIQGPDEPEADLTIVVANDNGGSIFATLEQGGPGYAAQFERLFATPHGADLAALCSAVRIPHWRVESRAELAHALANPNGGIEVVEAAIGRTDRRRWEDELRALVDDSN
ncbi:MAG: 2-succinyl-5-enolpyruvyl-6-hydroxy-3-cyclohexene-1-carboxylic-acid synthase [Marmoricola sp.]